MSQALGKPELLHRHFQLPPSFHLRWLHLESAELFCRVLFHPVIVKPKSGPYYCFPELLSSCSRASSAPPHTSSFTTAILAEPFHPSCLNSSAGSLSITWVALSTWASAPSQISFPTHGSSIAQLHALQPLLWVPCLPLHQPCQIHLGKLLSSNSGNLCCVLFTARRNCYPNYIS